MARIPEPTRSAIRRAAVDARAHAPVPIRPDGRLSYDQIDLASDTDNHWYSLQRLTNAQTNAALRYIRLALTSRMEPSR